MAETKTQRADDFEIFVDPSGCEWYERLQRGWTTTGELFGRDRSEWRAEVRQELGLATDRPIIATGHQTLLWHPGILAKYLAVDAFAAHHGVATANLIVDQHADQFGSFEMPVRRADGSIAERLVALTTPRKSVPMRLHDAFDPPKPPDVTPALPSVADGYSRIMDSVRSHTKEPNAALQMAAALADLMSPWVEPIPSACATDLMKTSLGRRILQEMIADPQRCARLYNDAVAEVSEAGIGPLLVRDDYVELPLWRIRADGRRMYAYDNDVENALAGDADTILMPRALFMTALVRLGMCDLFVHGTGGARYDRAMELWIERWIGATPVPIAVATADMRLPLQDKRAEDVLDPKTARQDYRRLWHDPLSRRASTISDAKQKLLDAIAAEPYQSAARRHAFYAMHEHLESERAVREDSLRAARDRVVDAQRAEQTATIARRRDWPFPLYENKMIDKLAEATAQSVDCPKQATSSQTSLRIQSRDRNGAG